MLTRVSPSVDVYSFIPNNYTQDLCYLPGVHTVELLCNDDLGDSRKWPL